MVKFGNIVADYLPCVCTRHDSIVQSSRGGNDEAICVFTAYRFPQNSTSPFPTT